jgi:hypothetical protein
MSDHTNDYSGHTGTPADSVIVVEGGEPMYDVAGSLLYGDTKYPEAPPILPPPRDDKGREMPEYMTDRALLVEIVTAMRGIQDGLESFMEAAQSNPVLKTMFGL